MHVIRRSSPLAVGLFLFLTDVAEAHVKWFSPYDVSATPQQFDTIVNVNFAGLLAASILMLVIGCALEAAAEGRALLRGVMVLARPLEANSELIIRASLGFLLVALWTLGGIILTPELKTDFIWISWFQLAIASCLLKRETLVFAAGGLVTLYALAIKSYGLFHLLDYPIFIGLAVYLALVGTKKQILNIRALDILRWSVAVTLLWASVEKWAYPQWSFPIILENPKLTMGYSREFYMQAAGFIEFSLSFALVLGPLVRRTAAALLLGIFISAIGPFGKIDAIGHAPIIGALCAIFADSEGELSLITFRQASLTNFGQSSAKLVATYGLALAVSISVYYNLHSQLYETQEIVACLCVDHSVVFNTSDKTDRPTLPHRVDATCMSPQASSPQSQLKGSQAPGEEEEKSQSDYYRMISQQLVCRSGTEGAK